MILKCTLKNIKFIRKLTSLHFNHSESKNAFNSLKLCKTHNLVHKKTEHFRGFEQNFALVIKRMLKELITELQFKHSTDYKIYLFFK